MQAALIANIRSSAPNMTPALGRVADYVLGNPQGVLYQSITEMAEEASSSEASVMRFCRELGFTGFQNFKLALAQELASQPQPSSSGTDPEDDIGALVQTAKVALDETARLLDRATIKTVAETLLKARQIEIFGVAASAVTASYLEYKLARLGLRAHAVADSHLATMIAATAEPSSVHVVVSSSGSTIDAVRVAELAHANGANVISITNRSKSPLAVICDHVMLASWPETPLTGGAFPSKISQLLIVDALVAFITRTESSRVDAVRETARSVSDRNY